MNGGVRRIVGRYELTLDDSLNATPTVYHPTFSLYPYSPFAIIFLHALYAPDALLGRGKREGGNASFNGKNTISIVGGTMATLSASIKPKPIPRNVILAQQLNHHSGGKIPPDALAHISGAYLVQLPNLRLNVRGAGNDPGVTTVNLKNQQEFLALLKSQGITKPEEIANVIFGLYQKICVTRELTPGSSGNDFNSIPVKGSELKSMAKDPKLSSALRGKYIAWKNAGKKPESLFKNPNKALDALALHSTHMQNPYGVQVASSSEGSEHMENIKIIDDKGLIAELEGMDILSPGSTIGFNELSRLYQGAGV